MSIGFDKSSKDVARELFQRKSGSRVSQKRKMSSVAWARRNAAANDCLSDNMAVCGMAVGRIR